MSDVTRSEADELHARLRDLCLPWEACHELAATYAVQAVTDLKRAFNEFAEKDPYEAGKVNRWDLSADVVGKGPVVDAMTNLFCVLLSRRGLLKIDPK